MDSIKEFFLMRVVDETGISGTGMVARGVVMPSGLAVMEWQTFHSSVAIYKNIADVEAIHGHNGKTLLMMGKPPAETEKPKKGKRKNETSKA